MANYKKHLNVQVSGNKLTQKTSKQPY